eukprot:13742665-Ditylum_brightwellii.AAC.1
MSSAIPKQIQATLISRKEKQGTPTSHPLAAVVEGTVIRVRVSSICDVAGGVGEVRQRAQKDSKQEHNNENTEVQDTNGQRDIQSKEDTNREDTNRQINQGKQERFG